MTDDPRYPVTSSAASTEEPDGDPSAASSDSMFSSSSSSSSSAGGVAATTDVTPSEKHHGSFLRELPILIAVALILALLIKAFLVQAFYIPSGSMENTLHVGDRVLVNKLIYRFRDIHRGEVVVFNGDDTSFQPEVHY